MICSLLEMISLIRPTIKLTGFATRQELSLGDNSLTGRFRARVANSVLSDLLCESLFFKFNLANRHQLDFFILRTRKIHLLKRKKQESRFFILSLQSVPKIQTVKVQFLNYEREVINLF